MALGDVGRSRPRAALLALGAAALSGYQLTRPGLLFGKTPDISIYLGASVRFVHGSLPYRDFVILQPPGFVLLASPLAYASEFVGTRDALAALRLLAPLLAAATVLAAGYALRHLRAIPVVVACGVLAAHPAELYALRGPMLEPFLNIASLAAVGLAFDEERVSTRSRLFAAGATLGLATSVKAPAVVPAMALGVVAAVTAWDRAVALAAGFVGAAVAVATPFFVAAPAAYVRDTVATQLFRSTFTGRSPVSARLAEALGVSGWPAGDFVGVGLALLLLGALIAAVAIRRSPPSPFEWFVLLAGAAVGGAQLLPAWYYPHYAAWFAPFMALLLAVVVSRLQRVGGQAVSVAACALVAVLAVSEAVQLTWLAMPDVGPTIQTVIPTGACALSDATSNLVTSDRFQGSSPRCSNLTDTAGTTFALGRDAPAAWRDEFARSDYLVSTLPIESWFDLPRDPTLARYVHAHFTEIRRSGLYFYVRDSNRPAAGSIPVTRFRPSPRLPSA